MQHGFVLASCGLSRVSLAADLSTSPNDTGLMQLGPQSIQLIKSSQYIWLCAVWFVSLSNYFSTFCVWKQFAHTNGWVRTVFMFCVAVSLTCLWSHCSLWHAPLTDLKCSQFFHKLQKIPIVQTIQEKNKAVAKSSQGPLQTFSSENGKVKMFLGVDLHHISGPIPSNGCDC